MTTDSATPLPPLSERERPISWWEPVVAVPVGACIGWIVILVVIGLILVLLGSVLGHGTELLRLAAEASTNFFAVHLWIAALYLMVLVAVGLVLRRHGGRQRICGYFRPIGRKQAFYAFLSGLVLVAGFVLVTVALTWASLLDAHSSPGETVLRPRTPGQFAITVLVIVVLAPFVEEIYFRGLVLDWLRQSLTPLVSALASAVLFALVHLQFLQQPGLAGWVATAAIAALGMLNAKWAQRTHSLRAPIAAHAAYNATLTLAASFAR